MLKVSDKKKALFYLVPLREAFNVSLTVREAEKKMLLDDTSMKELHEQLSGAQKFVEGFVMRFAIEDKTSHQRCLKLIRKMIALRT